MKFKQRLKARGYPENIIESSLSGVSFASRQSFLAHTEKLKRSLTFIAEGDRGGRERAGSGRTGGGKWELYEGGKREKK